MSYIGTPPSNAFTSLLKQDFSTSATTGYTLDHAVNNANDIALFINFVRQEPTAAYAASGTTLTLTSATASSDDMYCVYLGQALQTVNPANASVGISQLSATGTKNSTTFLRGDNTFDTPPLGGITEADQWRQTAETSVSSSTAFTSNWERNDTVFDKIGTGVGGKVLQFVNQEENTAFNTTSSSAVDSGINVSITPTAANSKILLTTNFTARTAGNTYAAFYVYRQINGGGYSNLDQLEIGWHYYINETISTSYVGKKVDTTHNTTTQIDYKIYCHVQGGGSTLSLLPDNANNLGNFSAMEIGA